LAISFNKNETKHGKWSKVFVSFAIYTIEREKETSLESRTPSLSHKSTYTLLSNFALDLVL
jgi:hypothetical protein